MPSDLETIAHWQVAMALESEGMKLNLATVLRGVSHVFENSVIGFYVMAEIDSKPAGCTLVLSEWSDWRAGYVLWIHSVYTAPEFRRQGVFRAIYSFLKAKVEEDSSLRGLRLYVDKSNQAAIDTYHKLQMNGDHYHLFEWMK